MGGWEMAKILFVFLSIVCTNSFAQDYRFTSESPSPGKAVKAKPATTRTFEGAKVALNYPRFDLAFWLNPGLYSLTQELASTGTKFNFSGINLFDAALGARMVLTPRLFAGLFFRLHSTSTEATDLVLYQLTKSSVTTISASASVNYCYYLGNSESRLCPGITLSYDAFPILGFTNNTDLSLSKIGDMGIGPNLLYFTPIGNGIMARFRLGYNLGLKQGQAAGFTMSSDSTFTATADTLVPLSDKMTGIFGIGAVAQSASFNSIQDQSSWKLSNLSYLLNFGIRYNFNYSN
jgi:hypothetical protein